VETKRGSKSTNNEHGFGEPLIDTLFFSMELEGVG
jgi:hypothetical protein